MLTRFGDTGPVFGLVTETTGFIQDFNQKTSFDEALVDDNQGNTVTAGYFNKRYEGSFTLIAKNGATLPDVMTAATVANLQTITKAILTEVDRKPEQKNFEKHTYTYKAWESISL